MNFTHLKTLMIIRFMDRIESLMEYIKCQEKYKNVKKEIITI